MTTPSAADLEEKADAVARRLGLMANPRRLMILCRLATGEQSVGALQEGLGISQSALSQHLAKLREGGIVATRRAATNVHYRLADPEVEAMMQALYGIFCGDADGRG